MKASTIQFPIALGFIAISLSACGGGGAPAGSSGTPRSSAHQWTWISGADADLPWDNSDPVYGMQGLPSPTNVPGGRNSAMSWTDARGNFWTFAGEGYDNNPTEAGPTILNDLWRYDPH
jgi:hypothetical protein